MAGDWIKMRSNLWDDPRVSKLCDLTQQTEAHVIGALYWLWSTADQHTEDGGMPGLTLRQIDRKTGLAGFGAALCDATVGWLRDDPQGVVIVRFEEHNGTSAKRRCVEAQRKANGRKLSASDADTLPPEPGHAADEKRRLAELEKEKSREEKEKNNTPAADASGAAKPPRASRKCPPSFEPTDPQAWVDEHTPGLDWPRETAKFRDHTFKNAISDWSGTWRNWMRRAFDDARGQGVLSFRERDQQAATARIHEMTGGLVSAKPAPPTRRPDALQEVFDAATPRRLG